MMLDDLQYIHERDAQDALGMAAKDFDQLNYEFVLPANRFDPANIVFAGMGGSALGAALSVTWPGYRLPFQIVRDYDIPEYVSNNTLFVASSYSGNTEETLSALEQAEEQGAKIFVIASGGELAERAKAKGYPLVLLPDTGQPRFAALYGFKALLAVLVSVGVLTSDQVVKPVQMAAAFIEKACKKWLPDVPTKDNPAKQLALELMGKSIVMYSGPKMAPAAYKWKVSFNENAKQVAWVNQLPEFNHNEFIGWSKQPVDKPYAVIDLRSSMEHERVQKRFVVSEQLLSGMRPTPYVVEVEGETLLEQLTWTVVFGDFVSLYLALANGIDPSPVDLVEKFKAALKK